MNTRLLRTSFCAVIVATLGIPVIAQFVVYDPENYLEAVAQYEQMLEQYRFLLKQAERVPVDIAARYHAHSIDWTNHAAAAGLQFAGPLLTALNEGDIAGAAYRALVDPLDLPMDVVDRMPAAMRRRFGTAYATVELFDSMTRLAVDQTGSARTDGPPTLQAIKNVEHDIANPADAFHSQTALLEKINAAEAIGLRLEEQTNQFLMSSLEQQLLEGKRKRDAEAQLMNATIYQWRFGQNYGQDLFRHTAADLDAWRPY